MLKLNITPDPRWVDLAGGVRIKARPLSSAMMLAARSEPRVTALVESKDEGAIALEVAKVIAGLVIEDWDGIGDETGQPVAVSESWINALLDLWPMFEAFQGLCCTNGVKGRLPLSPDGLILRTQ